jgi:hypothetical protein
MVADPVVFRDAVGNLSIYGIGPAGDLVTAWQPEPGGVWLADSLGGDIVGDLDVATLPHGGLVVFVRDEAGRVWHKWQSGPGTAWGAWFELPIYMAAGPVVHRDAAGNLSIYGIGPAGDLVTAWQPEPGGLWLADSLSGSSLVDRPSITTSFGGGLTAYVRDASGKLLHKWQSGSGTSWGPFAQLGQLYVAPPPPPPGPQLPEPWACTSPIGSVACLEFSGYSGASTWGYPVLNKHNCTNYAAFRLSRRGVPNPGNLGNANTWDDNARSKGITVNSTPAVGAVVQWDSGAYGHVGYVDEVGNGWIKVSESHYGENGTRRTITTAALQAAGAEFIHF